MIVNEKVVVRRMRNIVDQWPVVSGR
jgi:hypothetical protein